MCVCHSVQRWGVGPCTRPRLGPPSVQGHGNPLLLLDIFKLFNLDLTVQGPNSPQAITTLAHTPKIRSTVSPLMHGLSESGRLVFYRNNFWLTSGLGYAIVRCRSAQGCKNYLFCVIFINVGNRCNFLIFIQLFGHCFGLFFCSFLGLK